MEKNKKNKGIEKNNENKEKGLTTIELRKLDKDEAFNELQNNKDRYRNKKGRFKKGIVQPGRRKKRSGRAKIQKELEKKLTKSNFKKVWKELEHQAYKKHDFRALKLLADFFIDQNKNKGENLNVKVDKREIKFSLPIGEGNTYTQETKSKKIDNNTVD